MNTNLNFKLFRPHSIFRNGATLDFSGGNYDLIL
jgi:hypothetical protein